MGVILVGSLGGGAIAILMGSQIVEGSAIANLIENRPIV
jgi:hypothetical protein